jgi:hypothetical protein
MAHRVLGGRRCTGSAARREGPATQTWEFICECPQISCHALVSLTLTEFDERRAATPPLPVLATEHGV